jgi:glycosyltransferase involved in cell wall biosynthesis
LSAKQLPLRVLLVTTSYPLTEGSASGIFVKRLVTSLPQSVQAAVLTPCGLEAGVADSGSERLYCFRYAPRRWQVLAHQPGGIPVALRRRPALTLLLPVFLGSMFLGVLRRARHCDLVHANWSLSGAVAALACLLARRPLLTTLRGEDVTRGLAGGSGRWLLDKCLRHSQLVSVVGEAMREALNVRYPWASDRLRFVPNGVAAITAGEFRAPLAGNGPAQLIGVGSLIPRKGFATLLDAMALLSAPVRLILVGDGHERNELVARVRRLGLEERVQFAGAIPPKRVSELLAEADVFVLPSYSEGRPNALLEAMAAGLPCVASDIDGVRELLGPGERGVCVAPGDARALAEALGGLLRAPDQARSLARKARAYVVEAGLLWPETGKRYARLYRETISLHSRSSALR